MLLGCIADDFTGATDLANNLVRAGMRTVLTNGVPAQAPAADAQAVVVALKSRTIAPALAVDQSLQALAWLREHGARQIYFKICSTFDSTDQGNIGPVTEALKQALAARFVVVCPAFPENGRTVFKGYLFAGDVLLNESGMQNHPLTPMTDPNLVRVLQRQCRQQVGLIDYSVIAGGVQAIIGRIGRLMADGVQLAIADATNNQDLMTLGAALRDAELVTAGSGVAIGLPQNFGLLPNDRAAALPSVAGRAAILSGSCSQATQAQVRAYVATGAPARSIDVVAMARGEAVVPALLAWAGSQAPDAVPLIYSTADAATLARIQQDAGRESIGAQVESAIAQLAQGLVERGVRRLVVAGGETSGAVVQALEVQQLQIGPQIDPGVPWCAARTKLAPGESVLLALKSGNFGAVDFFAKALGLKA